MKITKEIPEFLLEMSKQVNEQGNRATADPMFEVRYKKYVITEEGYNEHHWEVIDDEGNSRYHSEKDDNFNELAEYLFEHYREWCVEWIEDNDVGYDMSPYSWPDDYSEIKVFQHTFNKEFSFSSHELPDELKKFHLQEIEVTLNTHFTEADANAFIKRKQHDYPKLYTYAVSLCYCENMKKLRDWIKDLTAV